MKDRDENHIGVSIRIARSYVDGENYLSVVIPFGYAVTIKE